MELLLTFVIICIIIIILLNSGGVSVFKAKEYWMLLFFYVVVFTFVIGGLYFGISALEDCHDEKKTAISVQQSMENANSDLNGAKDSSLTLTPSGKLAISEGVISIPLDNPSKIEFKPQF